MSSPNVAETAAVPLKATAPWKRQPTKESRRHGGFATSVSMLIGISVVKPRLECFVMVTGLVAFAKGTANGVRETRRNTVTNTGK